MKKLFIAMMGAVVLCVSTVSFSASIDVMTLYEVDTKDDAAPLGPGHFGGFLPTGDTDHELVFIVQDIIDWAVGIFRASDNPEELIGVDAWHSFWSENFTFEHVGEHEDPCQSLRVSPAEACTVIEPPEVPLPAAGWLFLSALGGLVMVSRRKAATG